MTWYGVLTNDAVELALLPGADLQDWADALADAPDDAARAGPVICTWGLARSAVALR